ncbi:hypothetical protein E2562_034411 [Oryza meyeriana var. granulata]|uniref:Helicase C-terminal domain-containing protein n=1 Tax=Oryza meyeriana var. granulata TaxID=110450 RepID=A0A6G1BNK1_9ORYZ|nr:hypothetical protein E2562_034411 [Oryza meyeriana var. granulata]
MDPDFRFDPDGSDDERAAPARRKPAQSPWEFSSYAESVAAEHARRRTTSIDEKISQALRGSRGGGGMPAIPDGCMHTISINWTGYMWQCYNRIWEASPFPCYLFIIRVVRIRRAREANQEAVLLALCLKTFKDKVIIFSGTKHSAHRLKIIFGLSGMKAAELHGNLTQAQRLEALELFKKQEVDFLIATDVAARGIDIVGVRTVINFSCPRDARTYLHRVGRTARAGREGYAVTFITDDDRSLLKAIVKKAGSQLKSRIVAEKPVAECAKLIEQLEDQISTIIQEEREERILRKAEMEATKAENMIAHKDEIYSRPKRTWFATEKEKKLLAKAAKDSTSQGTSNSGVISAQQAEDLRLKEKRRREREKNLPRKKRRRLEAQREVLEDESEDEEEAKENKGGKKAKKGQSLVDVAYRRAKSMKASGDQMASWRRAVEQSAWVVEVEKVARHGDPSAEAAWWRRHSIYRVPACIKDLNRRAYQPQVVSLGPFHHGDPNLLPMEEHKRRALLHFLRRVRPSRPLAEFAVAVADAAEQLEGAYQGLADEWRRGETEVEKKRERFLEMMIVDGCFLLEVMRTASGWEVNDYADDDPVFSSHGLLYTVPYIRRDMIMIENQLPLLVLVKLVAVESGIKENEDFINRLVQRFLSPPARPPATGVGLALHPLDILRRSLLVGPAPSPRAPQETAATDDIIRSAEELYEAGIRLRRSPTSSLLDIRFHRGVLHLPVIAVDDTTEYILLNLMAFERLHAGAGNDVTAYVFFMDNMIDSARDVALLTARRIIYNTVGSDKAVARLFNGLSRDVVLEPQSALDDVHREVNAYCRRRWHRWRANLVHTYFRSPWSFLSLAAAVFLLVMTVMQTVYTVLPFYKGD